MDNRESGNGDRRQRRIAARQAQILEAAEIVFSQKGYERATTRDIADMADVAEGTLYNYFGSKSEILDAVAQSFADTISDEIAHIEVENLHDMMAELLTARLRSGRERRLLMLFLYEARLSPDVHRVFIQEALQQIIDGTAQRFQTLIDAGVMRPVDPALAAKAISATIMGFAALYEMGQYGQEDNGLSPQRWGEELTGIFLDGLQAGDSDGEENSD